jgi:exopolyphosphatase/pppGpp-phosphohydrolase
VDWLPGLKAVYAIGGTALAAGRLRSHYLRSEAAITHGSRFSAAEYALMLRHMDQDADAAKVLVKVLPERLYLINPGLSVFRCLIAATGAEEFCISRKGLRKGYIQILRERGGL